MASSTPPRKLRKQYANASYPLVILRFEDGHEIRIYRNTGKEFDAWPGERVKLMAVHDLNAKEWDHIETRTGEAFEDAPADG